MRERETGKEGAHVVFLLVSLSAFVFFRHPHPPTHPTVSPHCHASSGKYFPFASTFLRNGMKSIPPGMWRANASGMRTPSAV